MRGSKAARSLKAEEIALLREVLQKRAPELLSLLARAEANTLERNERLRLCELISAEFAETGIGADSEPLPRGLELEGLLDVINRPNILPDRSGGKMSTSQMIEFARLLIERVRDISIRNCEILLRPDVSAGTAIRWKRAGAQADVLRQIIPDIVDETVFSLLHAVDGGEIRLKFVASDGREIDLTEEGLGELAGEYIGPDGWRAEFSSERFVNDITDSTA